MVQGILMYDQFIHDTHIHSCQNRCFELSSRLISDYQVASVFDSVHIIVAHR